MAMAKQATTTANQRALAVRDLDVEMCTRPWIVELSKNSRRIVEVIFMARLPLFVVVLREQFLSVPSSKSYAFTSTPLNADY